VEHDEGIAGGGEGVQGEGLGGKVVVGWKGGLEALQLVFEGLDGDKGFF
jgi:hypothetical protein